MSILTEKLPDQLTISGKQYVIPTDFRVWIKFSQLAFSAQGDMTALAEILTLIFDELPNDLKATIEALLDFYGF